MNGICVVFRFGFVLILASHVDTYATIAAMSHHSVSYCGGYCQTAAIYGLISKNWTHNTLSAKLHQKYFCVYSYYRMMVAIVSNIWRICDLERV